MATTKITQVGKRIVNDSSLIFYYDATNTIRSFKGKPTTNLFAEDPNVTSESTRPPSATAGDGFSQWNYTGTDYVAFLPDRYIKLREQNTTGGHYIFLDSQVVANTAHTMSVYAKPVEQKFIQLAPSTGFTVSDYANFKLEGEGSITGTGASNATIKLIKSGRNQGWYRCTYTATSSGVTGNGRMVLALVNSTSAGRLQSYTGTATHGVYITDPQFEASSFATPFVDGTRNANGDSIIDLTGNLSINALNLTYNSDNTFEFGPRTDAAYLQITDPAYPASWADNYTFEIWHYVPTGADWEDTLTFGNGSATCLIGRGSYQGSHGIGRNDTNLFLHIVRTDSGLVSTNFTGAYDTWYHLVGTYDGTNNRLYVNGELKSTAAVTISGVPDGGVLRIGGNVAFGGTNGGYAEGKTPIARMYSKALSAAEVKQNFIAHRNQFGL